MRDAAVGFQCPSCVAEGARSTRSARTAYGGLRSANPGISTAVLVAINAAVWLAVLATGGASSWLVERLALLPQGRCVAAGGGGFFPSVTTQQACQPVPGAQWLPGVADGAYWQLLTGAFTHVAVWHVAFNMLALWVLGPQLELAVGRVRFLALYLISALAGSTLVLWTADPQSATLGASGAIFGLLGALLVLAVRTRSNVQPILFWIGLNFLITLVAGAYISWQGHLGGFLGGVVVAAIVVYSPRRRRSQLQAVGLTTLGVVLVVAIVVRSAALAG